MKKSLFKKIKTEFGNYKIIVSAEPFKTRRTFGKWIRESYNITKEIRDGQWHIDFKCFFSNILSVLLLWGLFPIAFYAIISQLLGYTKVADIIAISPIAITLIFTYLTIRLFQTIINLPHYKYEVEET